MKKIAIFSRPVKNSQKQDIVTILRKLDNLGCELAISNHLYNDVKDAMSFRSRITSFDIQTEMNGCSFLLSIGGDGTLLETISYVRDSGIPVLGLNTGRLGFLANTNLDDFESAISQILDNNYEIDKRSLLRTENDLPFLHKINFALNEIALTKSDHVSMIKIDASIDDIFLNTYWADGIIIATPTGSTAYSLSCGGPIIMPAANCLIMTPIASHNLTVRPLVVPDNSKITLTVNEVNAPFLLHLDSRKYKINKKFSLTITKENFSFNLIKLRNDNFLSTIRNKLMWGLDKRN